MRDAGARSDSGAGAEPPVRARAENAARPGMERSAGGAAPAPPEKGTSLWRDAWRRLLRNRMAVVSGAVLLIIGLVTVLAPVLPGLADPDLQNLELGTTAPSWAHPFGTDLLGRDLLSRVVYGGRVSILVGIVATLVSFVVGVSYGAISGYHGGRVDDAMMRFVDVLYSLPYMFLVILLMVYFSRSLWMLFAALGLVQWLTMARIVRGQVLSLKAQEFVEAARSVGTRSFQIIFRHLVPNALGPILVYATLTVPAVMLQEAFLSFLGMGVQPPQASWGTLVNDGAGVIALFPWMVIFPGMALATTLFCLNFLGDGLRDALDPHLRRE
jgi:oligopeptide transport system permease protein